MLRSGLRVSLDELRQQRGLSITTAARSIGVSTETLMRAEIGQRVPKHSLRLIRDFYGVAR
jgi:DNA-binding XRE family transcriptional regulator